MPASSVRRWLGLVLALATGLLAAYVDARPGFDDTAVLVGLLVAGSAAASFVGGGAGGLWTVAFVLAAGLPVPLVEMARGGGVESVAALAFAAIGVAIGAVGVVLTAPAASSHT